MRSDWSGTGTFPTSGSAMQLSDAVSVEWRSSATASPVTANLLNYLGHPTIRIVTAPGEGWVRLHLKVNPEDKPVLGARFVILPLSSDKSAVLKPFVAVTNLRTGSRAEVPAAPPVRLKLEPGHWFDLAGTFLVMPMGAEQRADVVVDLPRDAQFLLAECAYDWFEGELEHSTRQNLHDKGALPLARFEVRPVPDLQAHLSAQPVYGVSARADQGHISGWAFTKADTLRWGEMNSGRSGAVRRSGPVDIGGFQSADAGLIATFEPALEVGAMLQLQQDPTATCPLWMGRLGKSYIGDAPVSDFLHIHEGKVANHVLEVEGEVVHPAFPGMPVRLELSCGETTLASTVARSPAGNASLPDAEGACRFVFKVPLRPGQRHLPISVAFTDIESRPEVTFLPLDKPADTSAWVLKPDAPAMPANATVSGEVESFGLNEVTGWAVCQEEPDANVDLILKLDDEPFAHTRTRFYRKEVQNLHGGRGFCGFRFELPPNMAVLSEARLSVVSAGAKDHIRNASHVRSGLTGEVSRAKLPAPRTVEHRGAVETGEGLSVVIVNRNGAELLDEMFHSCAREDLSTDIEWIVVDHGSDDASERVCERHAKAGANIRFIPRNGNYSFSDSNNFGARLASGEVLVFANNDLVFSQAFTAQVRSYLRAANIGVVGARLVDHVPSNTPAEFRIDQHLGVFLNAEVSTEDFIRPYEARNGMETNADLAATRCIAVTGAFLAMRRGDFETVGGFDERYSYGLEDVDLCLKVGRDLGLDVICANDIAIVHHRGHSRQASSHTALRTRKNNEVFTNRWGAYLRRMIKATCLTDPALMTGSRPVVAFISASEGPGMPSDGEAMARGLGMALQDVVACHVRHVPESDWYDLAGVDFAVVLTDRFDPRKIEKSGPWLTTVRWMYEWFDQCAEEPVTQAYDHLFATSDEAATYLEKVLGRSVHVLPAAAAHRALADAKPRSEWACDYCLAGDRTGTPREIEFHLRPDRISGKGRVFGAGWEKTALGQIGEGQVEASSLPDVYASARVVLDDTPLASKAWGSVSPQAFDAMAAGALLISNDERGCSERFGDLVPTYSGGESLRNVMNFWLDHEDARQARVAEIQKVVWHDHTYDVRARSLLRTLASETQLRISIKCAAASYRREEWGDFHFANGLANALRRLGYVVRVDCREDWYCGMAASDDVVIVLRGRIDYRPKLHQKNILWMISHPELICIDEMMGYDQVYVASEYHTGLLDQLVPGKVEFMAQCTDTDRFFFDADTWEARTDRAVYVANSRGEFRRPAKWALENDLELDIYGAGWAPFIESDRLKGGVIPNAVLSELYGASRLVVCDHWDYMRDMGYISNRVFDVLGSGGHLVVDSVRGLEDIVPERYYDVFRTEQEFADILRAPDGTDPEMRREAVDWVARNHSFEARAIVFSEKIQQLFELPGQGKTPIHSPALKW